jgi:hypothetical protein
MLLKLACRLLAPAAVLASLMPYINEPVKLPATPAGFIGVRPVSDPDPGVAVIGSDASAIPAVLYQTGPSEAVATATLPSTLLKL